MAKKRRFTTQIIAKNILKKIFVSLFWSVILMITVTIQWMLQSHQVWSRLDSKQKKIMLVKINSNWRTSAIVYTVFLCICTWIQRRLQYRTVSPFWTSDFTFWREVFSWPNLGKKVLIWQFLEANKYQFFFQICPFPGVMYGELPNN